MDPINQLEPRISIISLCVSDMKRSYNFYANGLGFTTKQSPDEDWVAFKLNGICFCIYPYDNLKKENLKRDVDSKRALDRTLMPSILLAYNTRAKHQVDEVLDLAIKAGGILEKEPEYTFWGGYSGYFADPDGHLWEVAWAESWEFNPDGSLVI